MPIEYDAHGADGQDNSFYVPSLNRMSFGDGGVDDGEDPDIILHEYGHAIQRGINRDWGGGDQRAMGEGFGDYWATALNRSRSPGFHPNWVFVWDGHNQYWPGRVLDANKKYPEDVTSSVHATGMIWSQALAEIRQAIGNSEVADKIVLEHHFGLGGRATMQDAARELIMADVAIFGGAHVPKIVPVLNQRGLLR